MQISSKLSHVVKVNKNNSFPWVSIRSGSRSHPQQHSLRCNHPPTTEVFCSQRFPQKITWDSQAFPLPQKSATDFYPPPGNVTWTMKYTAWLIRNPHKKKRLMILKLTGESTNIGKNMGRTIQHLRVFKVPFRADRQFRPWKEDIESS